MQIHLARGVDHILFGMGEETIESLLGKPNKIVLTDFGNRDLCYYKQRLILKIEPSNANRLGWISVRNRAAQLDGIDPWSMDRRELLERLSSQLGEPHEFQDYGDLESYSFSNAWLELQFELDELTSINFGVPYDFNDRPVWPPLAA